MLDQLLDQSPNFGSDKLLLLPVLIALEAILSADNAIALAAIAQGLEGQRLQQRALNFGLVVAFGLRVVLILTATWVMSYWQFELMGAAYLLWLVYQHFFSGDEEEDTEPEPHPHHHVHRPRFESLWQAIPMIALTDLAFSLDSVAAAISVSQELWLVLTGGLIGIIALRFMAGLFIGWLKVYDHLEDAGFLTVALVGLRLLVRVLNENLVPPEWVMVLMIGLLFAWGFSKRTGEELSESNAHETVAPQFPEGGIAPPEILTANPAESIDLEAANLESRAPQEIPAD